MGQFGRRPRYWAERMLDDGLCHLLATDAHNTERRAPRMAEARELVAQRLGEDEAANLVLRRPQGILNDLSPAELPAPPQARAPRTQSRARSSVGVEQYRETCSTDGRSPMKKLASFWRLVFFTLAVPLLVSNCMETAQTNGPVVTEQPASASALASGETAMAEAQTNRSRRSRAASISLGACECRHGNG